MNINEIKQRFFKTPAENNQKLVGMEIEHLVVESKNSDNASYERVCELLGMIKSKINGEYLIDSGIIVGLECGEIVVTLEPGAQFEVSIPARQYVSELEKDYYGFMTTVLEQANQLGLRFLDKGISPKLSHEKIKIVPKPRYLCMAKCMTGKFRHIMMKETASVQVTLDYFSEQDAIRKLRIANYLSPIVTALFANSNIRLGKNTGYKSFRALAWLHTDNNRCGFLDKKLFDKDYDYNFDDYIGSLLDIPMLFIVRENKIVEINNKITFNKFISSGFKGFKANYDDFELHASLIFPEVRMRKYLELRSQDSQSSPIKFSIPALYKGLLYNDSALGFISSLLDDITFEELELASREVPKLGMDTMLKGFRMRDLTKLIVRTAYESLSSKGEKEERYLIPLMEKRFRGEADFKVDFGAEFNIV